MSRGPALKPSFAVVGNYLVVTAWPMALKNLIHGWKAKTPRLQDKPDFAERLVALRGEAPELMGSSLLYLDLKSFAGFVADNALPVLQMLGTSTGIPVDFALAPRTEVIVRHIFGLLGEATWKDGRGLFDVSSPLGALPLYAVIAVPAVLAARLIESEVAVPSRAPPPAAPAGPAGGSQRAKAALDLRAVKNALHVHFASEGGLPSETGWRASLLEGTPNHPAPYLDAASLGLEALNDPWGRPYLYRAVGEQGFELKSLGADGAPGGGGDDADIVVSGTVRR